MDDTIQAMIETGFATLAQQRKAEEEAYQREYERIVQAQRERLEILRGLFPEALRPYVNFYGNGQHFTYRGVYLTLQVPGLGPIYAMAEERENRAKLEKVYLAHGDGFTETKDGLYLVPNALIAEVEDGIYAPVYESIFHTRLQTDDLNVALALAQEQDDHRTELVPEALRRNHTPEAKPSPEPSDAEKLAELIGKIARDAALGYGEG